MSIFLLSSLLQITTTDAIDYTRKEKIPDRKTQLRSKSFRARFSLRNEFYEAFFGKQNRGCIKRQQKNHEISFRFTSFGPMTSLLEGEVVVSSWSSFSTSSRQSLPVRKKKHFWHQILFWILFFCGRTASYGCFILS